MASRLSIGQVAKASGVAAKTIRYYEQIGVLPAPSRATSGYRLYDQSGVERLHFIRRARSLGLPLQQLKTLMSALNGGPRPALRPQLRALVRGQLDTVKDRIAELELLRQQLEQILERMRTSVPGRHPGACQCLETKNGPVRRRRREARPSGSSEATP
jgi:MerR family transcriptional regulator, copper efflux regulator